MFDNLIEIPPIKPLKQKRKRNLICLEKGVEKFPGVEDYEGRESVECNRYDLDDLVPRTRWNEKKA